jgi:uncharacterized protein YoxC
MLPLCSLQVSILTSIYTRNEILSCRLKLGLSVDDLHVSRKNNVSELNRKQRTKKKKGHQDVRDQGKMTLRIRKKFKRASVKGNVKRSMK